MRWPEMQGWFINWNEHFGWDAILFCLKFKNMLDDNLQILVGLRVFQYLAVRGECFPAQNSSSKETEERRLKDLEQWHSKFATRMVSVEDKFKQQSIKNYFEAKQPPSGTTKRKRQSESNAVMAKKKRVPEEDLLTQMLKGKTVMRELLKVAHDVKGWTEWLIYDEQQSLDNNVALLITADVCAEGVRMYYETCVDRQNLQYWAMANDHDDVNLLVSSHENWSFWASQDRPKKVSWGEENAHPFVGLLKHLSDVKEPYLSHRFQNYGFHFGFERIVFILHHLRRHVHLAKVCLEWWKEL